MRKLSLLGAFLLVAGLFVWAFMPRPVDVETAVVGPGDITVFVEEEGKAQIREVFTISATIGGKLQRVDLHAGDEVEADRTVVAVMGPAAPALLDARSRAVAEAAVAAAQSAVDLADAQVAQAEAALEFARADAERSRALFAKGTISTRVLDSVLLAQKSAQAAFDSAVANRAVRAQELASAQAVLADGDPAGQDACCVRLVSPVSGRILRVLTESEQVVPVGAPIMEVGDPTNLEVVVDLLSSDAVRIREGAAATVTDWGGTPLAASVERVEPSARTEVSALGIEEQRVEVILALDGEPSSWAPLGHGFRVVARIEVWKGEDVLAIPVGALFRDGSAWAAYVVRNGRAELRRLILGHMNDVSAEVLSGVEGGDRVVLHPSDRIAAGVRLQEVATE